jgi:hypothetical protein
MSDLLSRLLPALRDIRTPLAVGYAWLVVAWAAAAHHGAVDTRVGELFRQMMSDVPEVGVFAGVTFVVVLVGSGVVRLMDRTMQLLKAHRIRNAYNPLDAPDHFYTPRAARIRRQDHGLLAGDVNYVNLLEEYLKTIDSKLIKRWRRDGNEISDYELRTYRQYLSGEPDFGALQAEQLLRFSLMPPIAVAFGLSFWWGVNDGDGSTAILTWGLALLEVVVFFDYRRTGTLLQRKWQQLVQSYPDWLPSDALARREAYFAHNPSGSANLSLFYAQAILAQRTPSRIQIRNEGPAVARDLRFTVVDVGGGDAEFDEFSLERLRSDEEVYMTARNDHGAVYDCLIDYEWTDENGTHSEPRYRVRGNFDARP